MRTTSFVLSAMLLLFICDQTVSADEIMFPETEQEIVDALSIRDEKTEFEGIAYESENGKVYKIINGKRYRLRGLQGIVDSKIVPKVGALIHFDFDSVEIRSESHSLLDEFGKALKSGLAGVSFIIVGHTDNEGSDEYNQKLSLERALSVIDYLNQQHQISTERLQAKGYGETRPIRGNDTAKGRKLNRRVEFIRID